jgi:hypothetical protein
MLNGDYNSKSKYSKTPKQDTVDHKCIDGVHGKESTLHEPKIETAAPVLKNPVSPDTSQTPKV